MGGGGDPHLVFGHSCVVLCAYAHVGGWILLPVWSKAKSEQTMETVILGLLLNTGGDLETQPVSNCRVRLSHIQTNGPTEPSSVHFFISQMKLIGFSGWNWEVIHPSSNR